MIIDIPADTAQVILAEADKQGMSAQELAIKILTDSLHQRALGGGEGYLLAMSEDFDAPLDDFAEYA